MKKANKNLKNLLLGCATFAMCCGVAGGVSMWTASADPITPTSNNFYCEGASIKITDKVDEARIRFHMAMTDELYNTYFTNGAANEGIETGMLVVPYDVYLGLDAEALDLNLVEAGAPVQNVSTTALWKEHSKDSTKQESIAYLQAGQIPEESHNRLLYFVGYVTDGTESGTYYTNARKISMSQVAMYAQEDETIAAYHDTLKSTYMHMHTITYKDAYERKAEIQFGESVLENTAYSVNANLNGGLYWDEACTDPVLSTDYVTGDMNVYVKNPNKAELLSFDYASDIAEVTNVQNVEWLDSYKGEIGVMKGSYTGGTRWTPQFGLHPMQDLANENIYTDYTHVGVRLYIVKSETVDSIWTYVRCNDDTKNIVTAVYNQWADYLFPVEDLIGDNYSAKNWGKFIGDATTSYGTVGEFYVSEIFLVNQANKLISFDYESDISTVTVSGAGTTKTRLKTFEGADGITEKGVLFVSHTAGTKWIQQFTFTPTQSIAEDSTIYENYKYVVLKMYIVKDEERQINSSWKYIFMNSSSAKYRTKTPIEYNKWVEYKFDIALLKDYASNSTIKFGGEEVDWVSGNQYWGEFYVDGVYLSNE